MTTSAFYFFKQLPSTNQWALQQERVLPFFCITQEQTLGRGRRANQWHSQAGDLLLSYAIDMPIMVHHLSVIVGMKLAQFFNDLGINIKVKWPNDLILYAADNKALNHTLNASKVGGILIENKTVEHTNKVVIGIGLNLSPNHQQQATLASPISYQQTLLAVSQMLTQLCNQDATTIDLTQWQCYDCLWQQQITFELSQALPHITPIMQKNSTFRYQMTAQGINEKGELLVYDKQTKYHTSLNNAFNIQKIS